MTFCLKSVEIHPSKIGIFGMFINGYYFICEMWHGQPRLNVSQALNGSSWILRVHLNKDGVLDGARCTSVGLCDCWLTVSVGPVFNHVHWKHWKLVSPSWIFKHWKNISKCLGNASTYVLSSSPYRRDVQGKTHGVNQKTQKMSHVLYHTTQFYHGRRSKNSKTLACLTAW